MIFKNNKHRRLYGALQNIIKLGDMPSFTRLSEEVGFNTTDFLRNQCNVQWKKEMTELIKREQKNWRDMKNPDFILFKKVLKDVVTEGLRPTKRNIAIRMGRNQSLFVDDKLDLWKIKAKKIIEEEQCNWLSSKQDAYFQRIQQVIKIIINKGERPSKSKISRILGKRRNTKWDSKLYEPEFISKLETLVKTEQDRWDKYNKVEPIFEVPEFISLHPKGESIQDIHKRFVKSTATIEEYKQIGLKLKHIETPLVISNIMYSEKQEKPNAILVKKTSFSPNRRILLDTLIKMIYNKSVADTSLAHIVSVINHFINFLYTNNMAMPIKQSDAREAYNQYSYFLSVNRGVKIGSFS